jgi:O-antigen/teichoic acid export membrane protein
MSKRILIKNAFIYTLTDVINKAIPFLLLPILTKYLSPSEYGLVATFSTFMMITSIIIELNMSNAINIFFFGSEKEKLNIYIVNTILISLLITIISLLSISLFSQYFSNLLSISDNWIYLGIVTVFFQFITTINLVLWQAEHEAKKYGLYQILQTILNLFLTILLVVYFKFGAEGQILAQTSSIILFSFFSLFILYKRNYLKYTISINYMKDAIKFGLPLIPLSLSGWLRTGADRLLLTNIIGTAATGIYVVGFQFGMIISILSIAFNKAFNQFLYKKLSNINPSEKNQLVIFSYIYFTLILFLALIVSIVSPWIIKNFLDEKYINSIEIVPWICFAYAFQGMYIMVVNYLYYIKKTSYLGYLTLICGVIHVLLSFYLIKIYGIVGAGIASLISFALMFFSVWILSAKLYPMPWLKPKLTYTLKE